MGRADAAAGGGEPDAPRMHFAVFRWNAFVLSRLMRFDLSEGWRARTAGKIGPAISAFYGGLGTGLSPQQ